MKEIVRKQFMFKSSHQLLQSLPYVDRHEMSPTDPGAVHVTHPHAEESGDGGVHCRPTLSRHDVAEARNIEVGVNFQRLFVYYFSYFGVLCRTGHAVPDGQPPPSPVCWCQTFPHTQWYLKQKQYK